MLSVYKYLDELLDGSGLLEFNLGDGSNGEQVLESVGDGVGYGSHGGVTHSQREGSYVGHSLQELSTEILWLDVQDSWREDGARVIHLSKQM